MGHGCDIQRCTCHSQLIFAVSSPFYEELLPSVQGCHTNRRRLKSTAAATMKREMLTTTHAVGASINRLFSLRILSKTTNWRTTIFQVFFSKVYGTGFAIDSQKRLPDLDVFNYHSVLDFQFFFSASSVSHGHSLSAYTIGMFCSVKTISIFSFNRSTHNPPPLYKLRTNNQMGQVIKEAEF